MLILAKILFCLFYSQFLQKSGFCYKHLFLFALVSRLLPVESPTSKGHFVIIYVFHINLSPVIGQYDKVSGGVIERVAN